MNENLELNDILEILEKSHPESKLQKVTERYMLLMASCIANEQVRDFFENEPRQLLENFVGLTIPEDAVVKLDPYGTRWPTVNFHNDKEEVQYVEGPLSVTESLIDRSGKLSRKVSEREDAGPMNVDVPFKRDECDSMVVVMPYFSMETDLLTEFKFKDAPEAELVLSTC